MQVRPSYARAHLALGFTLRRAGCTDEALQHFVHAGDLDPLNRTYAFEPVKTLLGLRRWPEAIEQMGIELRRFPP